jgi:alpha-beta hydrolase superfamily lysophospholipase
MGSRQQHAEYDVERHEGVFWSKEGLVLFRRGWRPADRDDPAERNVPARSVVAVVHGHGDHSGRYAHLGEYLARHGHAVEAMDLRGHGRSQGARAMVDTFDQYLDDAERFLSFVQRDHPGVPVFMLGHSMGGTVVALLALARQPDIAGLILCSAALCVSAHVPRLLVWLAPLLSRLAPELPSLSLDSGAISRDPEVVAAARADPLMLHGGMRARTGAELHRAIVRIQADMEHLARPLLILHGTADAMVDVAGSEELAWRAGSEDKTLLLYEGFYHEVLSDPERERVQRDVLDWLDARA